MNWFRPTDFGRYRRLSGVAVLAAVLSGCALWAPARVPGPTDAQRVALLTFTHWALEGRIGVWSAGESWSAGVDWEHLPASETVRLSGPLGQGAVEIHLADGRIRITGADGSAEISEAPEALLQERIGVAVPLAALRYWVVGLPEPGVDAGKTYDSDGRLAEIRQRGWVIVYKRYMAVGNRILPQKLEVRKEGVRLNLVVDRWHEQVGNG